MPVFSVFIIFMENIVRVQRVLISGGTGFIGSELVNELVRRGYKIHVLTRNPDLYENSGDVRYFYWDWKNKKIDEKALEGIDAFIHLAGANIAEKKWNESYKAEMAGSRILSLKFIKQLFLEKDIRLKLFIGASAIGYYGCVTDNIVRTEDDPPGNDFLARLVVEWENMSLSMQEVAEKVTILRTGIVWGKEKGAFSKMIKPIRWGLTSPLGSGQQYLDWIHIRDLVRMYIFALENASVEGVYNAVAPYPVTYKEFVQIAAAILKKPCCMPGIPAFLIRLVFGESACLMLEGVPISSEKIQKAGFAFDFDHPVKAVKNLIQSS